MLQSIFRSPGRSADGALVLVRRLVVEFGIGQWRRYALGFALMGVPAAWTAVPVWMVKNIVNLANLYRDFRGVVVLGFAAAVIFAIKGAATYGQTVILSRIANHIIAQNQRRVVRKLLDESIGFFQDRHSSEF